MRLTRLFLVIAMTCIASAVQALTISVLPPLETATENSQASVTLHIDFGADTAIGGGFLIDLDGSLSFASFTPSAYFNTLDTAPANDTDFTGFGTSNKPASAEFEIHLGSFAGISGSNDLGTLTVNTGALPGAGNTFGHILLSASPDSDYGGFLSLQGAELPTTFNNGHVEAAAIPLPAAAWLFATGVGCLASARLSGRRGSGRGRLDATDDEVRQPGIVPAGGE